MVSKITNVLLLTVLTISLLTSAANPAFAANPTDVNAETYFIADVKTGRVLAEKNKDMPMIPASLTKIMTLFILFDEIDAGNVSLDDMVHISRDAWATGGSKMFVMVDTQVKLSDLVKGVAVMSGNDACVALAEHLSGTVSTFVDRMNQKASLMGLSSARFFDPHGLSDDNRISAQDLFTLVIAYVREHPSALPYHALKEFTYTPPGDSEKAPQFNRNRLLWSYPGVFGLKTGFTTKAGYNMVALCEREGMEAAVIVLGSAKGKSVEQGEEERSSIVMSLLDWVYGNFTYVKAEDKGTDMGRVRVWKGKGKWVSAIAPLELGATLEKGDEGSLVFNVELQNDLEAPILKGSKVGAVVFTVDGEEVGRTALVAKEDVPKGNFLRVVWDSIARALLKALGKA